MRWLLGHLGAWLDGRGNEAFSAYWRRREIGYQLRGARDNIDAIRKLINSNRTDEIQRKRLREALPRAEDKAVRIEKKYEKAKIDEREEEVKRAIAAAE